MTCEFEDGHACILWRHRMIIPLNRHAKVCIASLNSRIWKRNCHLHSRTIKFRQHHCIMPKTALISGGARGIGRCLVRRFLELGYHVYIFDIDEEELNHTTHNHLKKYSESKALASSVCNLRDVEQIRAKVKEAAEFLGGRIDVLINNGGIASPRWKDGKTMADLETFNEWQAYVSSLFKPPLAPLTWINLPPLLISQWECIESEFNVESAISKPT